MLREFPLVIATVAKVSRKRGLWFIGMKIAQPYRVFQLSERGFDAPSCIVKFLDMFWCKLFMWQVRNNAFIC